MMEPTMKLRWVQRTVYGMKIDEYQVVSISKVLQQWWAPFHTFSDGAGYQSRELKGGEWRDIPIEEQT